MDLLRIKKWGTFLIVLSALISCATIDEVSEEVVAIEFQSLKRGTLMGGGQEEIEAGLIPVKTKEDWNSLIARTNKINEHIDPVLIESVDLNTDMLIAIFDEVRGSGGYTFEVDRIDSNGSEHLIYVNTKAPEGSSISVLTQPYELISIPKTSNRFRIILQ